MLFITLHAKHYSKKYPLWYYLAHESLEFMTSNDLTLNHKKLIILRDMSLLNKSLHPSLSKKYYFTILGLYFSWMLTSALVVDQTIWPWNSTGIWYMREKLFCLQQPNHWILTTAITGISTPRFPALLEAWKTKVKLSKHLQNAFLKYLLQDVFQASNIPTVYANENIHFQLQLCILQIDVHKVTKRAAQTSKGLGHPGVFQQSFSGGCS